MQVIEEMVNVTTEIFWAIELVSNYYDDIIA